jgi:hydroxymethylglutaryl-CoA lyase
VTNLVKIIECPRDAWQGLPLKMPAEVKADYLRALVAAGFRHIDAVSFLSAAAVPQMADSERVLEYLDLAGVGGEVNATPDPEERKLSDALVKETKAAKSTQGEDEAEIIGMVSTEKGAERAVKTGAVSTLAFPYSISPGFLQRNQNQTPEESLEALEAVGTIGYKAGLDVVAYISMAFGNPYGDAWSVEEVVAACDLLVDSGVRQISLADTVGLATPEQVAEVLGEAMAVYGDVEIGVHLHARYDGAAEKIRAAYGAGCRRFDSAIGGLGGSSFAQDALVGNIPTETLIEILRELGADFGGAAFAQPSALDGLVRASEEISRKFGAKVQ